MQGIYPFIITALILIATLHIGSAITVGKISKILSYVNIGLHIAAILLFLIADFRLEATALFVMSSILFYLLTNIVYKYIKEHRREKNDL